jgi:hypothetical protein
LVSSSFLLFRLNVFHHDARSLFEGAAGSGGEVG